MMRTLLAGTLCACAMLGSAPAFAKAPKESNCSFIHKTEDGKFRYDMRFGWRLYWAEAEPGDITYPESVVGVACLRDPALLVPEDAETLKLGLKIYLGSASGQNFTYELVDGKVVHNASIETLGKSQMKKLEKVIATIEASL